MATPTRSARALRDLRNTNRQSSARKPRKGTSVDGSTLCCSPTQGALFQENRECITTATTSATTATESTTTTSSCSNVDFVAQLPIELALLMLTFCDYRDCLIAAQVSRRWYKVTRDPLLWRCFFVRRWRYVRGREPTSSWFMCACVQLS